jgi:hypothetical protein
MQDIKLAQMRPGAKLAAGVAQISVNGGGGGNGT